MDIKQYNIINTDIPDLYFVKNNQEYKDVKNKDLINMNEAIIKNTINIDISNNNNNNNNIINYNDINDNIKKGIDIKRLKKYLDEDDINDGQTNFNNQLKYLKCLSLNNKLKIFDDTDALSSLKVNKDVFTYNIYGLINHLLNNRKIEWDENLNKFYEKKFENDIKSNFYLSSIIFLIIAILFLSIKYIYSESPFIVNVEVPALYQSSNIIPKYNNIIKNSGKNTLLIIIKPLIISCSILIIIGVIIFILYLILHNPDNETKNKNVYYYTENIKSTNDLFNNTDNVYIVGKNKILNNENEIEKGDFKFNAIPYDSTTKLDYNNWYNIGKYNFYILSSKNKTNLNLYTIQNIIAIIISVILFILFIACFIFFLIYNKKIDNKILKYILIGIIIIFIITSIIFLITTISNAFNNNIFSEIPLYYIKNFLDNNKNLNNININNNLSLNNANIDDIWNIYKLKDNKGYITATYTDSLKRFDLPIIYYENK